MGIQWGHGDYMEGGMFLWWILIIIAIGGSISYFIRLKNNPQNNSALELLKKRYAHGDISKKEFENKKKDIM
jgi:putative membrane protein